MKQIEVTSHFDSIAGNYDEYKKKKLGLPAVAAVAAVAAEEVAATMDVPTFQK